MSAKSEKKVENVITTDGLINGSGKNAVVVSCQRCPSKLLSIDVGDYKEAKFIIPLMSKKPKMSESTGEAAIEGDLLTQFWTVDSIYKFDNMGFTNTVNNMKYLLCADCEIGPIGVYDMTSEISYLALERVTHK
ncbi:hypothetical protein CHUAL_011786 [Chamberlinius hualienensis]